MWEKRANSAEGKTIRIAESSDMDSGEAVLGHVQVLEMILRFEGENEVDDALCNYASGMA